MKKIILSILVAGIVVAAYLTFVNENKTQIISENQPAVFKGSNATFSIDGEEITLTNGVSETEAVPGSSSKLITSYFGNEIRGDLTGDGKADTAFLVTQSAGGSGLFYYAVVAIQTDDGHKTTNAFFIGDRIAPQPMYIPEGSLELHVNYVERMPGESMTAQPSQGAVKLLKVTREGVLEGLMK